jgi:hypothetical protein
LIILGKFRVNEAEQAGVTDRAVAAQRLASAGEFLFTSVAETRVVDEAALVRGIIAGPRLLVGRREILAPADEVDRGLPVEVFARGEFLRRTRPGVSAQGFERNDRVVEIGVLSLRAAPVGP